jgi:hypothetical protein
MPDRLSTTSVTELLDFSALAHVRRLAQQLPRRRLCREIAAGEES